MRLGVGDEMRGFGVRLGVGDEVGVMLADMGDDVRGHEDYVIKDEDRRGWCKVRRLKMRLGSLGLWV